MLTELFELNNSGCGEAPAQRCWLGPNRAPGPRYSGRALWPRPTVPAATIKAGG